MGYAFWGPDVPFRRHDDPRTRVFSKPALSFPASQPPPPGSPPEPEADPQVKRVLGPWAESQRRALESSELDTWSRIAERLDP